MPRKTAGAQPAREGTLDMLSARSSAVRARLGNDSNVSVDYIEACGDCFYLAIESALSEICGWQPYYAVAMQRQLVASQITDETYQLYQLLHAQRAEGFAFMQGVDSLEALRRRVLVRGKQHRPHKCVWADGFAMEVIANHFGVLLLVIDERVQESQMFTRIAPRGACAPSSSGEASELDPSQSLVLLHSSSREHMNLIMYNGKKLPQLGDLPAKLQRLWGISAARRSAGGSHTDGCAPLAHQDFQRFLGDGVACGAIRPRPGMAPAAPPPQRAAENANGNAEGDSSSGRPVREARRGGGGGSSGGGKRGLKAAPAEASWSETAWSRTLRPRRG